ncbi:MAG: hypothetical protein ACR2G7_02740 [Acidimicrobiales bacterium]
MTFAAPIVDGRPRAAVLPASGAAVAQVRSLLADAWRRRDNLTFADGATFAEHLDASLLIDDHRLADWSNLPESESAAKELRR